MIPSASRYEGPANKECARAPAWVGFISLMRLGIPLGGAWPRTAASRAPRHGCWGTIRRLTTMRSPPTTMPAGAPVSSMPTPMTPRSSCPSGSAWDGRSAGLVLPAESSSPAPSPSSSSSACSPVPSYSPCGLSAAPSNCPAGRHPRKRGVSARRSPPKIPAAAALYSSTRRTLRTARCTATGSAKAYCAYDHHSFMRKTALPPISSS